MLEVNHEIVQAIAKMPTRHTWAVKLMALPVEQADRAESLVDEWITKEVKRRYPRTDLAERIVRHGWLPLLEGRAIEAYLEENPQYWRALTPLFRPEQAVNVVAMDFPFRIEDEDIKAGTEFLRLMQEGKVKPNLEEIMKEVQAL